MIDTTQTKALGSGGELELTVVRFEAMKAYEMLGRLQEPGARTDPKFLRDMLGNSSIVREDDKGQRVNISLTGDVAINRAFRGHGVALMVEALGFAIDVNFSDFFVAAEAKLAERAAAGKE